MGEHRRNPRAIAAARAELAPKPRKPTAVYAKGEVAKGQQRGTFRKAARRG